MKFQHIFLVLFLFAFLFNQSFAKRPAWINAPLEHCSVNELCAVGEGSGLMMAEANARKALAKIFETQVKSKTNITTTAHQKQDNEGLIGGTTDEDVFSQVEETTDEVLKGVVIKETFRDKESIFALASLKKSQAIKSFQGEMSLMDEQIAGLFKDGRRASLNKVLKLFKVRDRINERYEFLKGKGYPCPVKYDDILRKKTEKRNQGVVVLVQVDELEGSSEIQHLIIQQLLANDYRVVTDGQNKYNFTVKGDIVSEKQYLNVEGFEKHKFVLKIKSLDKEGVKLGALEFVNEQTARSREQAYGNALPSIKEYIADSVNELNID